MAEAEDVILSAAERVASATRQIWANHEGDRSEAESIRAVLRLDRWLVALFGRTWPIALCDHPVAAGWLRRAFDRPAPWQIDPQGVSATDGACLYVPRESLESEAAFLALLALGRRLARGLESRAEASALCRDVQWVVDAAQGDVWLAALLPGLGPRLARARAAALGARPPLDRLRDAERAVEELVRTLLLGREAGVGQDLARWLDRDDAGYRGVAPVPHWGVFRDPQCTAPADADREHRDVARSTRIPMRRLTRPIRRRRMGEQPSRPGPFIVPPSDPHLSVQDPRGLDRIRDTGPEEIDALAEELSRLEELSTTRSEEAVREVLEAAVTLRNSPGASAAIPGGGLALAYPEWEYRSRTYRDPGVYVRERSVPGSEPDWPVSLFEQRGPLVDALRRQFAALRPRLERLSRQIEGDEIDVDAWAEERAERLAGASPRGRLYRATRRRRRELAVALLVDASGSTDSWISREARVIDIAKDAALCFSEALSAVGDRHAIYAFSGRGPADVRVWVAKRFAEPLGPGVRARIGALAPDRSTRLGGAVRHVTAALARESAQTRILLVVSDGKPNDDDDYEGDYGVEDVRRAVGEAAVVGVRPFCVTIDRRASTYLPRMFGPAGYTLLWDAAQLPRCLPQIYRHLTRGLAA